VAEERSDGELVSRYLAGDGAAFTALVHRHQRRVYNLAYRMLGREDDANDATQDAFLTALRKLSTFRGEAQFTTWMHRVTVNVCYDVLRKRQREPRLAGPEDDDEPHSELGPAAPDHADAAVAAIDVQRALLQVPLEFRVVLVMHDVQDMAYEDIAETIGVPIGTVKSRLHRGRAALGRLLTGEHGGVPRPSDRAGDS